MANTNPGNDNEFNGKNEKEALDKQFHKEHADNPDAFSKTENELSTGNSIRNFGEVSGTTFGAESNPAKFSNIGADDQGQNGGNDSNRSGVNNANDASGNGGTGYSDYLNNKQNNFIADTGPFANNEGTGNSESNSEGNNKEGNQQ